MISRLRSWIGFRIALAWLVRRGDVERMRRKDGQMVYRLTKQGRKNWADRIDARRQAA